MDLGVTMFLTDRSMTPAALARAAEERGLSSVWLPEHTHIPVSRATPAPMGEPLPEEYRRTLDPFVALATAAAVTTTLRLGTGICLVAQRDPVVTAKEVATLDHLSDGRFTFGVGFGWNVEELGDHGVAFRDRRAVARERMLAMRRLWSDDEASFTGDHVRLEPSWAWPKPAQRPGPPVFIGGAGGPTLFAHIAEYADGWLPIGGGGVRAALPDLRKAAEEAGRDPDALRVIPFGTVPSPGKLEHYADLGITEVVLQLPSGTADRVLPVLDGHAALVGTVA
jgi:probable F420-dependent oxidoreductase